MCELDVCLHMCVPSVCQGQKRVLDSLGLELTDLGCSVASGIQTLVLPLQEQVLSPLRQLSFCFYKMFLKIVSMCVHVFACACMHGLGACRGQNSFQVYFPLLLHGSQGSKSNRPETEFFADGFEFSETASC